MTTHDSNKFAVPFDKNQQCAPRVTKATPTFYRLFRQKNGILVLQAGHQWWEGTVSGIEWKDVPTEVEK